MNHAEKALAACIEYAKAKAEVERRIGIIGKTAA